MKRRMMKKQLLAGFALMAAACCTTVCGAQETQTEAAEADVSAQETSAAAEEYGDPFWNSDSLIGEWRSVWCDQGTVTSTICFLSDTTGVLEEEEFQYTCEDGKLTFPFTMEKDGMTVSGEFVKVEDTDPVEYGLNEDGFKRNRYFAVPDEDYKLVLSITEPDNSDPLSPKEINFQVVYLKALAQNIFFANMLEGHTWDVNGKTLEIAEDGKLNLDGGEVTGQLSSTSIMMINNMKFHSLLTMSWDDSYEQIDYFVKDITEDAITLEKARGSEDTIMLTLKQQE